MGGTALVGEPSPSLDSGASSGPIPPPPPPVAIEGPLKLAGLTCIVAAAIAGVSSFAWCGWCSLSVDDDPRLFLG